MFIMHALISIQTMFGQLFEYESIFILSKNNSFVMGIVKPRWHESKIVKLEFTVIGHHVRLVKGPRDSIWIQNA